MNLTDTFNIMYVNLLHFSRQRVFRKHFLQDKKKLKLIFKHDGTIHKTKRLNSIMSNNTYQQRKRLMLNTGLYPSFSNFKYVNIYI